MLKLILQRFLLQWCLLAVCLKTAMACKHKLLTAGVTEEDKMIILKEHNRLRQMVATGGFTGQPNAKNMREIVWDEELAERAQKWAENCEFRHDPFRTINRFTMGQNIAIMWNSEPFEPNDGDFASRIQRWFDEVQKYSFGDAWSKYTGHYSQLVWGETSLVGCGYAEYKDRQKYNKLYVCNYGPGGNVVGFDPYEVGKPSCASYDMKPSSRYPGLCAAPGESTRHITNAIETYGYNNNKKVTYRYNSYKSYNTKQQTNKYTTTTNTQYNHDNNNENTYSNKYQHHQQATSAAYNLQQAQQQAAYAATPKRVSSSYGGFSFGSTVNGGSHASTTEPSQQQYNKYQNKYESYKPSPEEFKRSLLKHTLLRASVAQDQRQSENVQQQQANVYDSTANQGKRGWSLLTWRG